MKILFLCVGNSARSQIAEGLAKEIFGDDSWIESAGSQPTTLNPYAVRVMEEVGIDISKQKSKSIENLSPQFMTDVQYIITLCAEEICPVVIARKAKRLHWGMPDPATVTDSDGKKWAAFQKTRDEIQKKLHIFAQEINKPIEL